MAHGVQTFMYAKHCAVVSFGYSLLITNIGFNSFFFVLYVFGSKELGGCSSVGRVGCLLIGRSLVRILAPPSYESLSKILNPKLLLISSWKSTIKMQNQDHLLSKKGFLLCSIVVKIFW